MALRRNRSGYAGEIRRKMGVGNAEYNERYNIPRQELESVKPHSVTINSAIPGNGKIHTHERRAGVQLADVTVIRQSRKELMVSTPAPIPKDISCICCTFFTAQRCTECTFSMYFRAEILLMATVLCIFSGVFFNVVQS